MQKTILLLPLCLFLFVNSLISQDEKMVIQGAIVIDNNDDPNPVAGTIRWTGADFEGYDGSQWLSLTCCNLADTTVTVTDQDGNEYPTVNIGSQCWMGENLRVTTYNDGTPIPFAADPAGWLANNTAGNTIPTYSWILDDPTTAIPHGAVYNWFAIDTIANGGKNICPQGWHVPTELDIEILLQTVDPAATPSSSLVAGGILKSTGDLVTGDGLWESPNTGAIDSLGFTAVPSIRRNSGGTWFSGTPKYILNLWSSDSLTPTVGYGLTFRYDDTEANAGFFSGSYGLACRCLKD